LGVEIEILKEIIFPAEKLCPYITGILSNDLIALGFPVMTFLNGGIEFFGLGKVLV